MIDVIKFLDSPAGQLVIGAHQYLSAAREIRFSERWRFQGRLLYRPTLHLICHGLELLLKFPLIANGRSIDSVRGDFNHDLEKLWTADANHILREVCNTRAEIAWTEAKHSGEWPDDDFEINPTTALNKAISVLSPLHGKESDFALRYILPDNAQAPHPAFLIDVFGEVAKNIVRDPQLMSRLTSPEPGICDALATNANRERRHMNAAEFFNGVARPNIIAAINQDDDYRLTVNAVLSIDATYGILFQQLRDLDHDYLKKVVPKNPRRGIQDSDFKEHLAKQNEAFAVIRDAAYATKHGRLDSKGRIVRSADEVSRHELVCGLFSCGDRLGASAILITIDGEDLERAWVLLRRVELMTEDLLGELELAPWACLIPEDHASRCGTALLADSQP